jgi:ribosomal protein S18 acetylase RimI-like enzyme
VVQYRSFRNTDPPHLVEVWNESFSSRGIARLRHPSIIERHIASKPYFDAAGLIVAHEDEKRLGFVHAGFGPNQRGSALSKHEGVICLMAVRPTHQRRGIGSELMERAEAYLRKQGAQTLFAGLMKPRTPFYFGIYGGAGMPGVLLTEKAAAPFLDSHGYRPVETSLVFQRYLDKPVNIADGRFAALRRRFDVRIIPRIPVTSWWQECVLGLVEPVEFRLEEKEGGKLAGKALAWEMESFSWTWNVPSVGLFDLHIRDDMRRQGLGKFLLSQVLRYLQDQYFGLAEIHTPEANRPLTNLYRSCGFEQADAGRLYKKG